MSTWLIAWWRLKCEALLVLWLLCVVLAHSWWSNVVHCCHLPWILQPYQWWVFSRWFHESWLTFCLVYAGQAAKWYWRWMFCCLFGTASGRTIPWQPDVLSRRVLASNKRGTYSCAKKCSTWSWRLSWLSQNRVWLWFAWEEIQCEGVGTGCFAGRVFCWEWCIWSKMACCFVGSGTSNDDFSSLPIKL